MQIDELETTLTAVSHEVRQLARTQGIHATLLQGPLIVNVEPPPTLDRHSQRAETVEQLADQVRTSVWTALSGASDTGKSQLAVLLVARVGNLAGWVRFGHDMEPATACMTLDRAISTMCRETVPDITSATYERALRGIGSNKLVVLDDLPRMNGADPLTHHLMFLVRACKATGVRILSTSHHQLPARLVASMAEGEFAPVPVPMLTECEVREILMAYEAPDELLTHGASRLICVSTGGHPLLVSLAARYLQDRQWRLRNEELAGLLRGDHEHSIADEVLDRIIHSLAVEQRELLYRLTLPTDSFGEDAVDAVSQVSPAIGRPREQLNQILGAWIQHDAERRFIVSPLVKRVGTQGLNDATRKECHQVLGELIVGRTMSIYEAIQAVAHFCRASEFNRAASLLLFLLNEANHLEDGRDIGLLDVLWGNSSLPEAMDLNARLYIRGLQLAVLLKRGRSIDYILSDIDSLLGASTNDHRHGITGLAMLASVHLLETDPDRTMRYVDRAISMSAVSESPDDGMLIAVDMHFDDMIWFFVPQLTTRERLRAWLSMVERLPENRRQRLFSGDEALIGCEVAAGQLRHAELAKPMNERHWDNVLSAVHELRERARMMGSGMLEGAAIRTLLTIGGEHLRNLDAVVPVAREALERLEGNQAAVFMMAGMLGQQYSFARRYDDARPLLQRALTQPVSERTHERMMLLLAANESFGGSNADQGIQYARQAAELAQSEETIPAIEASRAWAELTSARFLSSPTRDAAIGAFATWSVAAERLIEGRDDSDDWKDLFVIFSHQTAYLTSMARSGRPPGALPSGEEFTAPIRGVFTRTDPRRVALFRQSSVPTVMWMLSQYATAAGDDDSAARWLSRAATPIDPTRLRFVESIIGFDMIPGLIASGKYADALDSALRYCHANEVFSGPIRSQDELEREVDLTESWNGLSAEQRETIERRAAYFAVLPASFSVGLSMLGNVAEGINQGRLLASVCRQVVGKANDPALWTTMADILERTYEERASGHDLVTLGNSFSGSSHHVLTILAYLGASLHAGPSDAFNAQLAVMRVLFSYFPPDSAIHRQLFLPLIENLWVNSFEQRRFAFTTPTLVEESLTQARQMPVERRMKAILRAIRHGVTTRADVATTAWLNADDE